MGEKKVANTEAGVTGSIAGKQYANYHIKTADCCKGRYLLCPVAESGQRGIFWYLDWILFRFNERSFNLSILSSNYSIVSLTCNACGRPLRIFQLARMLL